MYIQQSDARYREGKGLTLRRQQKTRPPSCRHLRDYSQRKHAAEKKRRKEGQIQAKASGKGSISEAPMCGWEVLTSGSVAWSRSGAGLKRIFFDCFRFRSRTHSRHEGVRGELGHTNNSRAGSDRERDGHGGVCDGKRGDGLGQQRRRKSAPPKPVLSERVSSSK